jgi:hypothetical protein
MKTTGVNPMIRSGLAWLMVGCLPLGLQGSGEAGKTGEAAKQASVADDFRGGLERWVVEQQAGGTVEAKDGVLIIDDRAGCTVWWRERLQAPVRISYRVTMRGGTRDGERRGASDMNCFWMATDPRSGATDMEAKAEEFFAQEKTGRNGAFASYDGLKTYYVGYGGNGNTTTRFRRYDGAGARPLLPEHDLGGEGWLIEEGREYLIVITVDANGRTTWARDGVVLFDYTDAEPLRAGWFGLRTVWARIEVRDFVVESG